MLSRRSFMAGVSAACLASWRRLNAAIGGVGKLAVGRPETGANAIRIGNFYYQAPNGIAFIQDDAAAFVINPGGSYNAGTVAPNDTFHKIIFSPTTATPGVRRVEFQWSRAGDVIVGRLLQQTPVR